MSNEKRHVSCFLVVREIEVGRKSAVVCFHNYASPKTQTTMSEGEATTSNNPSANAMETAEKASDEFIEPETKRRKITKIDEKKYKLEERLGGILCCAVCLDLPRAAVYQVSGHFLSD
jgi:hypothetical protein